jgi:HEAT repeat protein
MRLRGIFVLGVAALLAAGCGLERERARRALKDDSPAVRAEGARRLGELRAAESVDALMRLLGDPSPRVRRAVVAALGAIGDRKAAPALVLRLRDQDTEVRLATVRILGDLAPRAGRDPCPGGRCPEIVEALLDTLDDPAQVVRRAAGFALIEIGLDRAQQVRTLAARRRATLLARLVHPSAPVRRRAAEELGRMEDPAAVPALGRALRDHDLDVAREAGRALGRTGGGAVAVLTAAAGDEATRDPAGAGLVVLAAAGEAAGVARLGELLAHPDAAVRRAAAGAAAARPAAERAALGPALVARLADEDPEVAVAAAAALDGAGAALPPAALVRPDVRQAARLLRACGSGAGAARRPAVAALVAAIGEPGTALDAETAEALAAVADPEVDRALAARAEQDYARFQSESAVWLDEVAWRSLDEAPAQPASAPAPGASPKSKLAALLAAFPARYDRPAPGSILPPGRSAADVAALVGALGRVGAAHAVCVRAATAAEPELRAAAVLALADEAARGGLSRDLVVRALKDPAPAVRRAAAMGVVRLGEAAVPLLAPLLKDADFELRATAARGLGEIRAKTATDALLGALRDDPQLAVVEALGRHGDRRAAPPLLERLREDTPQGHEAERAALIDALGALAAPQVAPALAAELWHPDPDVRVAAARALGALPATARGPAGREALEAHAEDPDAAVRRACRAALAAPGGLPASRPAASPPRR